MDSDSRSYEILAKRICCCCNVLAFKSQTLQLQKSFDGRILPFVQTMNMIDNTCANFFCAKVSRVEESMDCCQEVPEKRQWSPDCSCDWASGQLSGKPATLSAVLFASVTSQQVEVEAPGSCLERGKPGQSVHAYLKLKSWELPSGKPKTFLAVLDKL